MATERQTSDGGSVAAVAGRPRFTVAEYEQMGALGLFGPGARVELIAGEVVDMAPKGERALMRAILLVTPQITGDRWLAVHDPVRLDPRRQPEQDMVAGAHG